MVYTEEQLVRFGEYVQSKERIVRLLDVMIPELTDDILTAMSLTRYIYDADIANFNHLIEDEGK